MRKNCETCKHDRLRNPICDECYNTSDTPTKWEAGKYYEPDTNADRIRAMSDEVFAGLVRAVYLARDCPFSVIECDNCMFGKICDAKYYGNELEWLKQPAE